MTVTFPVAPRLPLLLPVVFTWNWPLVPAVNTAFPPTVTGPFTMVFPAAAVAVIARSPATSEVPMFTLLASTIVASRPDVSRTVAKSFAALARAMSFPAPVEISVVMPELLIMFPA